ncbi:MAG: metallophosphoesterase [Ruminococcus sp.]|nr:metallophosphoesterase [Ruminococcus sp.]
MIFITGDIHGSYDIHKFSTSVFSKQKELSRSDYMIICGDFGLVWSNSAEERYWLKWLDSKPWTTLWIDGNHENFDLLKEYPVEEWHGGQVQKITENIIHLCRGSVNIVCVFVAKILLL